jgi:hypothetical protein
MYKYILCGLKRIVYVIVHKVSHVTFRPIDLCFHLGKSARKSELVAGVKFPTFNTLPILKLRG